MYRCLPKSGIAHIMGWKYFGQTTQPVALKLYQGDQFSNSQKEQRGRDSRMHVSYFVTDRVAEWLRRGATEHEVAY